MYRFVLWLVPTVEKFPRRQKFLLGDRLQATALDVLERLVEATYTRDRRRHLTGGEPRHREAAVPVPSRRIFAPGTPTSAAAARSGGLLPADVDELAASGAGPQRWRRGRRGHRGRSRRRRVDVPADVARANPFTPPTAGTATTWR